MERNDHLLDGVVWNGVLICMCVSQSEKEREEKKDASMDEKRKKGRKRDRWMDPLELIICVLCEFVSLVLLLLIGKAALQSQEQHARNNIYSRFPGNPSIQVIVFLV
mmetsp:Transcript_15166/g.26466  ORF Transcript_15166/g.26466 Transcript_15166/m.26466 type:complete len:107 (+) Transcript_15166:1446-1766(+)